MANKIFWIVSGKKAGTVFKLLSAILVVAVITVLIFSGRLIQIAKVDKSNALQVSASAQNNVDLLAVKPETQADFFVEYRLERERLRSQRAEMMREVIRTSGKDEAIRQKIHESMLKMTVEQQRELQVENLIKARGFSEALVIVGEGTANAIIKSSSLSREEVVRIADIISKTAGIRSENIIISTKI